MQAPYPTGVGAFFLHFRGTLMHIDLSGKTAVVTGASSGIGLAIARGLAQAGARVTLSARDAGRLNAAVAALQAEGLQAQGIAADLATAAGCQALIAALPDTDILVNNLGIYGTQDFFAITGKTSSRPM